MKDGEELPEGWRVARLADVAEIQLGKMLDKAKQLNGSRSPYLRNANVRWGTFDLSDLLDMTFSREEESRFSLAPGDVIVCEGGEPGRAAVWREKGSRIKFQKALLRVRPAEALLPDWLALSLRRDALAGDLEPYFTGSTIKHFTRQSLLDYSIALPPRREQARIVEGAQRAIETVRGLQGRLTRVAAALRGLRRAVLVAAFDGRLTGDNASDWPEASLGGVFSVQTGGTPLRSRRDYFDGGSVPWIKTGQVQNGEIRSAEEFITERAVTETNAKVFPPGTILIAMYGEGRTRGQVARLRIEAATNQACAALVNRGLPEETLQFVYWFLRSRYEAMRSVSVGGNQPNLSLGLIKSWPVSLPPAGLQRAIVNRIESLFALADAIEKRVAAASARADKLTQAILAKAFRGELVPTEAELSRRREASTATPPPAARPAAARPALRRSR